MKSFLFSILFVSLCFIFSSISHLYAQVDSERQLYDNDELFQQLSGAKRSLLEQKFGKKESSFKEFVSGLNQGMQAPQAESIEIPLDVVNASDVLVNNNTGATGTAYFTQSETSILAFGNNVLIGFNDSGSNNGASKFTGFSYSLNGGVSFTDGGTLPTNAGGDAGDPVFARNETTGRIYFSTLGFNVSTIQVFRSDNNGVTWLAPVNGTPGGSSEDKQWMTVDNFAGAGNGNVYLISRRFGGTTGIYLFRSLDNGATFGPTSGVLVVSASAGNVQGAYVAVGPDHSVYAFWYEAATGTIKMRKSTDFGVSFTAAVTVASGLVGGVNGDLGLTGLRQGTATFSSFRSNQFPHVAINPVSGHLYVTFDNDAAGTDKADIFMVMSTNGGSNWTSAVRVNDDATTTDQWMPTIAVTPDGSKLGIFYYSRQEDTGSNNLFKYYGRIGSISGSTVTFNPGFAISDVGSLPEFGRDATVNSVYMGDYNHASVTTSPNTFHVVWSDNRDDLAGGAPRKDPNVYYEKISLAPSQFLVWEGAIGGQDYSGTYIKNFLTGLSYTVDHTSVFPADLTPYQAVFLCFGMYPGNVTFDSTKAARVKAYLEAGGRVYLEGNDALEFDQGGNAALHNLFGIGAGSDGGTNVIDGLQGQVGSITEGMLFTASTQLNNGFIDIHVPVGGKTSFIESGYGDVAVQYSGAFDQKTFCFSYALAYLTDGSFPNTKTELMTRILNFLIGPPALPPDISVTPSSLTFSIIEGGNDADIITLNNLGQQTLIWNLFEQDPNLPAVQLKLEDGRELPVSIQPKFDWSQPVKGEDYVPLPPSVEKPLIDLKYKPLYGYEPFENSTLFGTDAFSTETSNGNYIQFDLGTPQVLNAINPLSDFIWAGDFGVNLTFSYAVNAATNRFVKINKTTGVITDIGPCLPLVSGEIFTGMAIDPTTGIVYLSSTNLATSWLYTVNTSTGSPSLVGTITNSTGMIAIAINNNGQMYGHDILLDVMFTVNKATAAGTVIGPLGFDANYGQGMDFDPLTGTLYLSAFNNTTFQAELRTGNTTTGSTTLVGVLGSTTPGGLVQLGWIGLPGEPFDCTWLSENPVSGLIPAGGNQVVDISVDATGLTVGTYSCELIINSNDPDEPIITIPITLNVTPATPPDINVTPTALVFNALVGGTDSKVLNIANTAPAGYNNLNWNITEEDLALITENGKKIPVQISTEKNLEINRYENSDENSYSNSAFFNGEKLSSLNGSDNNVDLSSYIEAAKNYQSSPEAIPADVLIVASDDDQASLRTYLTAFSDINVVDYFDARLATPSLAQLTPYDVVFVYSNNTFLDAAALGNVLADYVDAGGGVVSAEGAFTTGFALAGRFVTDGYSAFVTGAVNFTTVNLGSYDAGHPIMSGVSTLTEFLWSAVTLQTGAVWVAEYSNAVPFVATKGARVACINGFFGVGSGYTGDMPFVLHNAITWAGASNVSWISANPTYGSIPAGGNQNVDVTVDATGLALGTYHCNLVINSNDPDEPSKMVPVTLNVYVTGPPPANYAIVTNIYDNSINIIDVATNVITGPYLGGSLGNGYLLDPVITPDGNTALISNFLEQSVYFVDVTNANNPSAIGSVNVGFAAEDIALTEDGAFAVVTDGGSSSPVVVIDVATQSIIQTLVISPRYAQAVTIAPNGTVLLADYFNSQLHVLTMNLSTGILTDLAVAIPVLPGPLNISIGPDGQTVLVANADALIMDVLLITSPGVVIPTGTVSNILNAQSIAFEKNGSRAFVVQTGTSPDQLAVLNVVSPGIVIDTGVRVSLLTDAFGGYYGVDVIDVSKDGNWAYVGTPSGVSVTDVAVVNLNTYTLAPNLTAQYYPTGIAIGGGASTFQLTVNIADGWNMVSIPGLNTPDQNVSTWWAFRDPGANVFRYSGGYQPVTAAVPGIGYWMKHAGARTYNTGDEWPVGGIQIVAHDPIAGASGWNLFGGYEI
ncbi:MAG: hypothetical protein IH618_04705, partial [Ignavibacteriaceae bacterium]|nr:hypothetical protein [Ignavibacteriaceae bacterium]